jgi:hypothetical protein
METCSKTPCKKPGRITLSYTPRRYCNDHFIYLVEKRIRKETRKRGLIKANNSYIIQKNKDKETVIALHFLSQIFGKQITLKTTGKGKRIIPTNLDRECQTFLNTYLENKKAKKQAGILFLDNVLDEELMHIAKILKIPARPEPKHQIIEAIEKKHPGMKFALNRSREHESIRKAIHRKI